MTIAALKQKLRRLSSLSNGTRKQHGESESYHQNKTKTANFLSNMQILLSNKCIITQAVCTSAEYGDIGPVILHNDGFTK